MGFSHVFTSAVSQGRSSHWNRADSCRPRCSPVPLPGLGPTPEAERRASLSWGQAGKSCAWGAGGAFSKAAWRNDCHGVVQAPSTWATQRSEAVPTPPDCYWGGIWRDRDCGSPCGHTPEPTAAAGLFMSPGLFYARLPPWFAQRCRVAPAAADVRASFPSSSSGRPVREAVLCIGAGGTIARLARQRPRGWRSDLWWLFPRSLVAPRNRSGAWGNSIRELELGNERKPWHYTPRLALIFPSPLMEER